MRDERLDFKDSASDILARADSLTGTPDMFDTELLCWTQARIKDLQDRVSELEARLNRTVLRRPESEYQFTQPGMSEELFSLQDAVNKNPVPGLWARQVERRKACKCADVPQNESSPKHWAECALEDIVNALYNEKLDRKVYDVIESAIAKHRPKVSE